MKIQKANEGRDLLVSAYTYRIGQYHRAFFYLSLKCNLYVKSRFKSRSGKYLSAPPFRRQPCQQLVLEYTQRKLNFRLHEKYLRDISKLWQDKNYLDNMLELHHSARASAIDTWYYSVLAKTKTKNTTYENIGLPFGHNWCLSFSFEAWIFYTKKFLLWNAIQRQCPSSYSI